MKIRNRLYIILAIICILCIISIETKTTKKTLEHKPRELFSHNQNIPANIDNTILIVLTFGYVIFFFIGIINLSMFIAKKIKKKPIYENSTIKTNIFISQETSSKLLFLTSFLILFAYVASSLIYPFKKNITPVDLSIGANMFIQIGIIFIILKNIELKFLNISFNKKILIFLLRLYSSLIPVILLALLINNFLAQKINVPYSVNPVINLLLVSNKKISASFLIFQIIFLGPIAEEFFFRSFVYEWVKKKFTVKKAMFLTSLIFALMHRVPYNILPLFVISLGLCYVYEKTQSILYPIIFHSMHNLINLAILLSLKGLL